MSGVPVAARIAAAAGPFLATAAAACVAARCERRPPAVRAAIVVAALVLVLLPVRGLPLYGYAWGIIGQPSITTMLLLACVVASRLFRRRLMEAGDAQWIFRVAAVAGLVLYPTGMGFTTMDAYRLGFQPRFLLVALAVIAGCAWIAGRRGAALVAVAAVAAFDLHVLESYNLWDYLTDPMLTVVAWCWAIWRLAHRPGGSGSV